jgi:hypothetical protein
MRGTISGTSGLTNSIRALPLHLSGSLKIPIFSNRLSLHKHDIACGQHGTSRCFCITTKDTPASGVVLRAQPAISSWQEDMDHEVHDLATRRPQTMCDSTLQAEAGTHANVCPRSSAPGEGHTWPTPGSRPLSGYRHFQHITRSHPEGMGSVPAPWRPARREASGGMRSDPTSSGPDAPNIQPLRMSRLLVGDRRATPLPRRVGEMTPSWPRTACRRGCAGARRRSVRGRGQ